MVQRAGLHLQAVIGDGVITGIMAGLIIGMNLVFFNVSMAALIFKGALTPYLAEGMSLGAIDYIVKPFTNEQLLSVLAKG